MLLSMYQQKAATWQHYYPLEAGEYAAATLHNVYLAIRRGAVQHFDNLAGFVLSAADNVMRQHHRYAIRLIGLEISDDDHTATVADGIGWTMPSAEMMAWAKEEMLNQ